MTINIVSELILKYYMKSYILFINLGAGNKLLETALIFCKEKQYKHVFLWTFSNLEAARHLYAKKGFQRKETRENTEWGVPVLEERWELNL